MRRKFLNAGLCILLGVGLVYNASLCREKDIRDDKDMREEKEDIWSYSENTFNDIETDTWELVEHMEEQKVVITGQYESSEYPYGYNVGKIQDDTVGTAILVTPGTSIQINDYNLSPGTFLNVAYEIHPWVASESDGAVLNVDIVSEEETKSFFWDVEVQAGLQSQKLSLEEFADKQIKIQLYVTNAENKSEACDWIMIEQFSLTQGGDNVIEGGLSDTGYVKSATYFSDEWPINFWNSEMDDINLELEQIKNDGFDSIILVLPWREFQPELSPISYNEYAFTKLDEVMNAAGKTGLEVYARIGYTWDFYNDGEENIVDRYCQLLGDNEVQEAWYAYVEKMYATLSQYSCFKQGFLTWEDFWNTLGVCDEILETNRREKAEFIGFQAWVRTNYDLAEFNESFGTNYASYGEIAVPQRNEPAMRAMYEFYDDFLNTLLTESQKKFPNLSMEVRMDWDVVYTKEGEMDYYKHTSTFPCGNSSYTATMYGIPMGFENVGERVSYEEALEKTEYILQQLKLENKNKPVYIEQFIFADNTPKFKNNAQIKEEELNTYLENVAPVLLENSEGYGIWTYRNYCANMLYNSQFALEEAGWDCSDAVEIVEADGSSACALKEGGKITQSVAGVRNHFDADNYTIEFDVLKVMEPGEIKIKMGSSVKKVAISKPGKVSVVLKKGISFNMEISSADCEAIIDNVKMYSQIQQGYLYDENNVELECASGIRKLNEALK